MIELIESAIVLKLANAINWANVEAFPDEPENYQPRALNNILIGFKGGVDKPEFNCVYLSEFKFTATALFKNLREVNAHQGGYTLIELIKTILNERLQITPDLDADCSVDAIRFMGRLETNTFGRMFEYAALITVSTVN